MTRIIYTAAFAGEPPCCAALERALLPESPARVPYESEENAQPFVRRPLL